ncbi:uncharacterized protein EHS24_008762 [Apiotrichum porosum]|uniref:Nucleolar 27S pre-rRNA processing Urb2/Npa2 C-terminal domain-containing protein n=1 Tax=Apiotrichum porosum TaxID=105984 RepID=A0A427XR35_9TREE|nr:uncharacterized protein EHS24_008762 [Apiotrichum porosum]RSH81319.1 hypothetical protein EHS24_008762 [Apiotrichum porosum]
MASTPITGSSLIKALKGAADPPTKGGPSKVELATAAWNDVDLVVPRKADVVRDWIVEAWTRAKAGANNPILDPHYHNLLVAVTPSCASPPVAPLTLLATYITSTAASPPTLNEGLGLAAAASFPLLFGGEVNKADAWAEVWGKLVAVLAASPSTSLANALSPAATLVCNSLTETLPSSQNSKKIAQSLHSSLPAYAATLASHPSLRDTFEPLTGPLFFPIQTLQTIEPLKALLGPLTPASPTADFAPALELVPHLFDAFVAATKQHRYTLYGRSANERTPIDVVVADKTRAAVIPALAACLELANSLEDAALARPSSSAGVPPLVEAIWGAHLRLWDTLLTWGGYLETDERAGTLLAAEARRAASALSAYGASDVNATDEGLAGRILRTLDALERLDHDHAAIGTDVVGWCLASPARTHAAARALLSSLLRFHQLTHSLGNFFDALADAAQGLFDASLPADALAAVYTLVAAGPLSDKKFRDELAAAVRSTNLGGRRSAQWAGLLDDIALRVRTALAGKRKREDAPARLVAVLSRLTKVVLDAGARAKEGGEEVEGAIGAAARAFEDEDEEQDEDDSKKKKKRKSDAVNVSADLVAAARLRVARSARLILRNDGVAVPVVAGTAELRLEAFHYVSTHLALTAHAEDSDATERATAVDAILSVLDGSAKKAWSGRDATVTDKTLAAAAWTLTAERGLAVLDATATSAQLDTLAGTMIARASTADEGYSVAAAVKRVFSNAETWELANVRNALLKALPAAKAGAFVVLSACPAAWLSKPARVALLEAAYATDAAAGEGDNETRAAIRTWLTRLAAADVYPDAKQVKKLLKSAEGVEASTLALVGATYTHLARVRGEALVSVLDDTIKGKPFKHADTRSAAAALLLDALPTQSVDKYADDIKPKLTALDEAARGYLAPRVASALASDAVVADADVFAAYRSLTRFSRWLSGAAAEGNDETGAKLLAAVLSASDKQAAAPLAAVSLDILAAVSGSAETVLAAFLLLSARYAGAAEAPFRAYVRTLSADEYATILSAVVALATTCSGRKLVAALHAIRVLVSAPVEGSGRALATQLHELLSSLDRAVRVGDVDIIAEALRLIGSLVDDRTGLLRAADAALILTTLTATLTPDASSRPASFNPELVVLALTPLLTLSRHRADLVLAHLPGIVGTLSTTFALLQRARARAGRSKAAARRPFWLGVEPETTADDPASAHAALLARVFVSLATARVGSSSNTGTLGDGDAPRALAGPLAKHAPALLVAYARAASDAWCGLSPSVRRELEPGLFSLCDVVTAGGRADGRGREGEGVGRPFGLGDAGDAEHEVWADMWRAWGRKRYTGQG